MKEIKHQETIHIGEWTIRRKTQIRWKVTGPEGQFTLHELHADRWRLVYGNSSKSSQKRWILDALGVGAAAIKGIGWLFGSTKQPCPECQSIVEVFAGWWRSSSGEPYHRKTLRKHAGYFLDWCQREGLIHWEELLEKKNPNDYVKYCQSRKLTHKTILHYLEPIRGASRWVHQQSNGHYRDFCQGFKISLKVGTPLTYGRKTKKYLPMKDVVNLLNWMRGQEKSALLLPSVALQGLCGLQLQEAFRLTWDRVDLVQGTVTIEEDRRLNPKEAGIKNQYRVRRIPLPRIVWDILLDAHKRQGKPTDGVIVQVPSWKAYCSRLYHIFESWNTDCKLPPSDLRNTLPTEAVNNGWMSHWLRRYFGHAPVGEIERSYLAQEAACGCREGTDEFVEKLRERVVSYIDTYTRGAVPKKPKGKVIPLRRTDALTIKKRPSA